jgi:putative oxidoreductase
VSERDAIEWHRALPLRVLFRYAARHSPNLRIDTWANLNQQLNGDTVHSDRFLSQSLDSAATLVGRLLLAAIFIKSGWGKIGGFDATQAYMQKAGVPGFLLPVVIAVELGGGLLIAVGWRTRTVAILLAGFTLLAALLFHFQLGDRGQAINFMKNLAITGGFLTLFAHGPGAWSVDNRLGSSSRADSNYV